MSLSLWDHPVTAECYRRFTERHDRYRVASEALVQAAGVAPGQRVLDVAAGIGCTAMALLEKLGPEDTVIAVEAAEAMRRVGMERTKGLPVFWRARPPEDGQFDRVICSAAIWAMGPVETVLAGLAGHLAPGGVLAVSLPAAYLGEPDAPGGGADPWLTGVAEALSRLNLGKPPAEAPPPLSEASVAAVLRIRGWPCPGRMSCIA